MRARRPPRAPSSFRRGISSTSHGTNPRADETSFHDAKNFQEAVLRAVNMGDDWWRQINVLAIDDRVPKGKYPKVVKRVGKSPPQYPDEEE